MKKYNEVEVTYTYSIDSDEEEKNMQLMMDNDGNCFSIDCNECLFFGIEECCADDEGKVDILRLMRFEKMEGSK